MKKILLDMQGVAVAYSGGVDSTLLLHVATKMLEEKALGIYVDSVLIQSRERRTVLEPVENFGARIVTLKGLDLTHPAFTDNPKNRCYFCKGIIFDKIIQYAKENGVYYVVDGSNCDDEADYRPGIVALKERRVRSPLQEAELTKDEIRFLSKEFGLPTWSKDALACLATRIPHGTSVSKEKLELIDSVEEYLVGEGFREVRARLFSDHISIEVRADQVEELTVKFANEPFKTELEKLCPLEIRIDLKGYKKGNLSVR